MTDYELIQLLSKKPSVGIRNRSNMCYFISIVLMMMDNTEIWEFIVSSLTNLSKEVIFKKYLSMAILYLVRRVYLKDISVDLINTIKALEKRDFAHNKNFNIGSQHNIECIFGDILNAIHDELGSNENSFLKLIPPSYKLVKNCTKCKRKSAKQGPPAFITYLSLPEEDNWDLQSLWDDHHAKNVVTDIVCGLCKQKSDVMNESIMFDEEPPRFIMVSPFRAGFDTKTGKAVLTTSQGTISPVLEVQYSDNGLQLRKK